MGATLLGWRWAYETINPPLFGEGFDILTYMTPDGFFFWAVFVPFGSCVLALLFAHYACKKKEKTGKEGKW